MKKSLKEKINSLKLKIKLTNFIYFFSKEKRHKLRKNYQSEINKLIINYVEEKYSDDYIIFSRNGIGDTYFVARLIKEFKKKNPGRVMYITEKPKLKNYLKSFSSIDNIVADKIFEPLQYNIPLQCPIQKGKINYLFFPYRGLKKNYVFADSYANLLNVDIVNSEIENPRITEENYKNAEKEFKNLNIKPQKTIILIPEAVMFDYRILNEKFWIKLANKLTEEGYDVIFNSSNKTYSKLYKTTFLPIMDFLAFSKQVNHIISFRSGICDVLVGVGITNLTAIYPPNLEVIWADKFIFDNLLNKYHEKTKETEFENIFHIYSLNSNFKRQDIKEIIHQTNKQTMQEILNSITEERLTTTKIKTTIK